MPAPTTFDPFGARRVLATGAGPVGYYALPVLAARGIAPGFDRLPYSVRILLESVLRHAGGPGVAPSDVEKLARWSATAPAQNEVPFKPARVVLQDFTGVPVLVDLAAMRAAAARLGGDPKRVNPLVPVDLIIDHSVQVDHFAAPNALALNVRIEFQRNRERYRFLKWGQSALDNVRVVPPATGIVHQVNLEYLAKVVMTGRDALGPVALPDTLVGTDSHTTMINGLGVLGWGVGGIEAEAAMLGQPLSLVTPQVVGVRLHGRKREGVTATDVVLAVTEFLRKADLVDKIVEFYGPGLAALSLPDRATIGNMAPEYGATMGFFPVDDETLAYLRFTGRDAATVELVERYAKTQGLFHTAASPEPVFTRTLSFDLGSVTASLAGPKRPQDRIPLEGMKRSFRNVLTAPLVERGFGLEAGDVSKTVSIGGSAERIGHGAVVIAAITSCTNTSNPDVLVAAGLVAQKAVAKGLVQKPWVKTSLAPGSRVVIDYLRASGLLASLELLGFNLVGFGCTTCIGNSGPLPPAVDAAVKEGGLVAAAVLSGNRNFEGRIHPTVKASYLASPPLVVAYALAGTTDIDLTTEPLGRGTDGAEIFLRDLWPTDAEVDDVVRRSMTPEMFERSYADVFHGPAEWQQLGGATGELFAFDEASTYIREPPFLVGVGREPAPLAPIRGARVLALLGDGVTTDHISPAGDVDEQSPAGRYLLEAGVSKADFNSYGSRRGNDRVMVRGTFANIRLRNLMVPGVEGGVSVHVPSGDVASLFDTAERYRAEGTPLVVLAGKDYGMGSSRDWAAKGTLLLGVRAVIAESFERIHRSNLVGMGVLPLVFEAGQGAGSLGLTGFESFRIDGVGEGMEPRQKLTVHVTRGDGTETSFSVTARLDTPVDVSVFLHGGVLPTVLRSLLA
ncbi:MAG: hypothetical protein RL199_1576 [Pseudomonadota bacterium]|jgi:aconitate hydratase